METEPGNNVKHRSSETLVEQVRALPRVVWILFAGVFINRFGTFVVPFLTLYLDEGGYSAGQIAWVFASIAGGGLLAMVAGGRLSDLIGRKYTMGIGLIGGGISMLFLWQVDSFFGYLWAGFLVGATHGVYHPAANSLITDVVPGERRVTAYAIVRWAVNLGFACGMAVAGFLAEKNFAWLFIGDFVTSTIYGVLAMVTLPHGVRTSSRKSRWKPALQHMIENRAFVAFFFAQLLAVGAFFQWGGSVARLITDLGYPKTVYGLLMAGSGFVIAIFEIPISQLGRRLPTRGFIGVGYLLCGIGVSINGLASGWIVVAIALVVFTVGEMISMPVSSAYLAELAPEKMRGRYSAAVGFTWSLNHAVAPGLGLVLYESNPSLLWWGMAVLGVLATGLMLLNPARAVDPEKSTD
ncbi:MAG: MFS transporter [Verrucomicrobiales bacterium]|nr:MFS transporter [Verrucomicrobiales bacterium]